MPFLNCEVLSWQFQRFNRDSSKILLNSQLNVNKYLNELGSDYYFGLTPVIGFSFERPAERKSALQFSSPIIRKDTIVVHLPKGYNFKKAPDKLTINSQFGKYELNSKQEASTIYLFRNLMVYPSFYDLEKYSLFYDFIKQVKEFDNRVVIISKASQNN